MSSARTRDREDRIRAGGDDAAARSAEEGSRSATRFTGSPASSSTWRASACRVRTSIAIGTRHEARGVRGDAPRQLLGGLAVEGHDAIRSGGTPGRAARRGARRASWSCRCRGSDDLGRTVGQASRRRAAPGSRASKIGPRSIRPMVARRRTASVDRVTSSLIDGLSAGYRVTARRPPAPPEAHNRARSAAAQRGPPSTARDPSDPRLRATPRRPALRQRGMIRSGSASRRAELRHEDGHPAQQRPRRRDSSRRGRSFLSADLQRPLLAPSGLIVGGVLLFGPGRAFNRPVSSSGTLPSTPLFGPLNGQRPGQRADGRTTAARRPPTALTSPKLGPASCSIDPTTNTTVMIPIPRDFWVEGFPASSPRTGRSTSVRTWR